MSKSNQVGALTPKDIVGVDDGHESFRRQMHPGSGKGPAMPPPRHHRGHKGHMGRMVRNGGGRRGEEG